MRTLAQWIEMAEKLRTDYRADGRLKVRNGFRIGQKVVCICDSWIQNPEFPSVNNPQMGKIYTVRIVAPDLRPDGIWIETIQLEEIHNPNYHPEMGELVGETWFPEDQFRPLRKTNISTFVKMLNKEIDA